MADKERWHWSMPFHLEDGSPLTPSQGGKSMDLLLGDWLFEEMKRDEKLVAITAAVPAALGFTVSVSVFTYCHKKTDQERRLAQFC